MDGMTIELPGFRFHPTEEELLDFYLKNMVYGKRLRFDIIGFLNIYHHDPNNLPGLAKIGEREWYFFVPRDRKHGSGGRPNRTTENGFWKATGSDRKIFKLSDPKRVIGLKKTLVFYNGRAPRGSRTDWVMNEYRLPDNYPLPKDVVLCKIYRKATSLKVLEQRAAQEEESAHNTFHFELEASPLSSSMDTLSYPALHDNCFVDASANPENTVKVEEEEKQMVGSFRCSSLQLPYGMEGLPELQVPKSTTDWNQMDSNWTLFNSPWLQNLTPNFYANIFSVLN